MERYIYLCEDSIEGIFSAIYQAYEEKHGHAANEIRIRERQFNREFFCCYREVDTDFDRAVKVARTVERDISREAYYFLQKAGASCRSEKADAMYRFVVEGLQTGSRVLRHLTTPYMHTLCDIEKNINNEICHWTEFLRFEELENGMLFARINPKNAVLPFMADHFSDRFSGEDWMIADTIHQTVLIHTGNQDCLYASMEEVEWDGLKLQYAAEEETLQELWKLFVDAIAIRERKNCNLQTQLLPLRFRKYMKEFS